MAYAGSRAGGRRRGPSKFTKARQVRALIAARTRKKRTKMRKRPSPNLKKFYFPSVKEMKKSLLTQNVINAMSSSMAKTDIDSAINYIKGLNMATSVYGTRNGKSYTATTSEYMDSPGKTVRAEIPMISETSCQLIRQTGLDKAEKKIWKTKIYSGLPTSSALKLQKRLQGGRRYFGVDTKQVENLVGNNIIPDRIALEFATGFNQRGWRVLPMGTTFTHKQVFDKIWVSTAYAGSNAALISSAADSDAKDRAYAGIESIRSQLSIANTNAFLAMNVRMHFIANKEPRQSIGEPIDRFANLVFSDSVGGSQKDGCIPERYQFSNISPESNIPAGEEGNRKQKIAQSWACTTSNKATLKSSPAFRDKYEIVQSFTKRLQPNDTWRIDHVHTLGGGLDYFASREHIALENDISYTDKPIAGFWVMEFWGTPVQAEVVTSASPLIIHTFQGTGPGSLQLEYKTSMNAVNAVANRFRIDQVGIESDILIRTFKAEDYDLTASSKERNVDFSNIKSDPAQAVNSGEAYIPLVTDLQGTTAQPRAFVPSS